ncbi:hypothetical protein BX600DRAFT_442516 [Xylariales sp. PMI_506]|nr:hypothetical protein BX600DRAFT_442516 [Xylariales sp. PMI_506]
MDITGYAFVTGGGSGIGKACCYTFAREGARGVVIADINLNAAKETAREVAKVSIHPDFLVEAVAVDVASESSVKGAISEAVRLCGRIDYVVHSAGVPGGTFGGIAEASFADFKRLMEINVHGTFLVTSLASAALKTQELRPVNPAYPDRGSTRGIIVNISSVASQIAPAGMVQYTTSKHAILGITKVAGENQISFFPSFTQGVPILTSLAAIDNVPYNIRVNCVCPAWTDTPMVQRALEIHPGLEQSLLSSIPMGRLGRAEEVADAAIYLCSPRSSFVTGISLVVDGAMSLNIKT